MLGMYLQEAEINQSIKKIFAHSEMNKNTYVFTLMKNSDAFYLLIC